MPPIYLPSPKLIPSPVYGIISRCPMYRIQVASESADCQSVLDCFSNSSDQYHKFTSQLRSSWKWTLVLGRTRDHPSIWVSPPESCYSRWEHRCSSSDFILNKYKPAKKVQSHWLKWASKTSWVLKASNKALWVI